jgi:hypothetical protein
MPLNKTEEYFSKDNSDNSNNSDNNTNNE